MSTPSETARHAVEAALAAQQFDSAAAIAAAALAAGDRDPLLFDFLAWREISAGRLAGARHLLAQGLAIWPSDADLLAAQGAAMRLAGELGAALRSLDAALTIAPGHPQALLERAQTLHRGGSLNAARDAYAVAASAAPRAAAFAGVAAIAAAQGDFVTARAAAGSALALDPGDTIAHMAVARADLANGAANDAVDRLQRLLANPHPDDIASQAQGLLGDALDALDRCEEAYAAYGAAKALFARAWTPAGPRETHSQFVERLAADWSRIDSGIWAGDDQTMVPGSAPRHAFLIGYPRSGTTLVETVLASLDGVETLEELPTLRDADALFLGDAASPMRLANVGGDQLAALRQGYWQRVAALGGGAANRLFVDMDPLKGIKLPIIARLFPAARIIVMRRDPRDVVWSCFRRSFTPSAAALEFVSLESTARHYAAVMGLQEQALAALPVAALELRYEDLVADFDTQTRRLCDFVGLEWQAETRDFAGTARRRNIATASVGQVRRGLFDGSGQWRRHAAALGAVEAILAPWVARFGYAD